jgi:hypothetical protein
MTALTGVKVIDMVGGEVSKISYNGEEYAKVSEREDGIHANPGDILLRINHAEDYARIGDYFAVNSDRRIVDREDDEIRPHLKHYAIFEKVLAESDDKLAELEERIAALEAAQQPLNVGDKVRLLSGAEEHYLHGFANGDICEVIPSEFDDEDLRIENGGGTQGYAKPDQLEKVSDKEAQQLEADRKLAAKFAEIGRKPGEFKAGDIVKVIRASSGHAVGTIGEVTRDYDRNGIGPEVMARDSDGDLTDLHSPSEIITPVERRFDR